MEEGRRVDKSSVLKEVALFAPKPPQEIVLKISLTRRGEIPREAHQA
jgi:hypothetical protein